MPPSPTELVLDIQSGRVITDARLQGSVDLQDAAAARKLKLEWDEPAGSDREVRFADPGRDAEVAYKHEVMAGLAGWKEVLLSSTQLDSVNDGIQPTIVFGLSGLPANNETLILKNDTDGTETFTWKTTAVAPFEVQIGGDVPTSLANLASQVSADSVYWGAAVHTDLPSIAVNVVLIRKLVPDDGDNDRTYGTTANGQVVDFGTIPDDLDYGNTALTALPASDPTTRNFGIGRATASLDPGEQHLVLAEDEQYAWDEDAGVWQQIGIVTPVATAASGGGVQGKWSADSDKGLDIAAGVGEVKVDTNQGIEFSGSGALKTKVSTTEGVEFNGSGEQRAKVDADTITFDGSGKIRAVASEGYLEIGIFGGADLSLNGVDGDTAYPDFTGDLSTLDRMVSEVSSGRIDVAYRGRLASFQTTVKQIRILVKGTGASPQYKLRVYVEAASAPHTLAYDGGLTAAPGTLTETVLTDASLSAQPIGSKRFHVVVEAHIDNAEEVLSSRPFVRQE